MRDFCLYCFVFFFSKNRGWLLLSAIRGYLLLVAERARGFINKRDLCRGELSIFDHLFSRPHWSRWHPLAGGPCGDFHRLFWKPPVPEEAFLSSSVRRHDRYYLSSSNTKY